VQEKVKLDPKPVTVIPVIKKIEQPIIIPPPKETVEELTSDQLMSILGNFGF